jgi:hypothetical protein
MRSPPQELPDLVALWLPLLRRLTDRLPLWGLWKNADAALAGSGDFDSTAPKSDWDAIMGEVRAWAGENRLGPITTCRHVRGVLFILVLDQTHRTFLELDVNDRKYFRGWTMFRPPDLAPFMEIDERGFRRVNRGMEGVILLVQNGLRWGGRPHPAGMSKRRIAEVLAEDPDGVRRAAVLFGAARPPLVAGAEAVASGRWNRAAMLLVEAWAVLHALAAPGILLGRLWSRPVKRRCPLLRTIFLDDRRFPDDVQDWLRQVGRSHPVYHS